MANANATKVAGLLNKLATGAVVLGTVSSLAQASLYTVDGGEKAVLFDRLRGVLDETSSEGMHFLVRARHPLRTHVLSLFPPASTRRVRRLPIIHVQSHVSPSLTRRGERARGCLRAVYYIHTEGGMPCYEGGACGIWHQGFNPRDDHQHTPQRTLQPVAGSFSCTVRIRAHMLPRS